MTDYERLASMRSGLSSRGPATGIDIKVNQEGPRRVITRGARPRNRSLRSAMKDRTPAKQSGNVGAVGGGVGIDERPHAEQAVETVGLSKMRREEAIDRRQAMRGESPQQMGVQERAGVIEGQQATNANVEAQTAGLGLDNQAKELNLQQAKGKADYQQGFTDFALLSHELQKITPSKNGMHKLGKNVMNLVAKVLPDFSSVRVDPETGVASNITAYGVLEPNDPGDPNSPEVFSLYQEDGRAGPPRPVMNKGEPVRIPVETLSGFAKIGDKIQMQTPKGLEHAQKMELAKAKNTGKAPPVKIMEDKDGNKVLVERGVDGWSKQHVAGLNDSVGIDQDVMALASERAGAETDDKAKLWNSDSTDFGKEGREPFRTRRTMEIYQEMMGLGDKTGINPAEVVDETEPAGTPRTDGGPGDKEKERILSWAAKTMDAGISAGTVKKKLLKMGFTEDELAAQGF